MTIAWINQRQIALDTGVPRVSVRLRSSSGFSPTASFHSADLRDHLAALSGRAPESIGRGTMTYQLAA